MQGWDGEDRGGIVDVEGRDKEVRPGVERGGVKEGSGREWVGRVWIEWERVGGGNEVGVERDGGGREQFRKDPSDRRAASRLSCSYFNTS